jgi:hypothetical protein
MGLSPMDMMRGYEFWRDGCRMMAMAICHTLRMAKEVVSLENIIRFVSSLPRKPSDLKDESWQKQYCYTCLAKAFDAASQSDKDILTDYFLVYFPGRTWLCQETLIDAFMGILSGIDGFNIHCSHVTQ